MGHGHVYGTWVMIMDMGMDGLTWMWKYGNGYWMGMDLAESF